MSASALLHALQHKTARVGVVGLGYVGLPLVRALVEAGYPTWGFDTDAKKIATLLQGKSYIRHQEGPWIAQCLAEERFLPTADMTRLADVDAILICVPTPLTDSRAPDLSYIESTARQIATVLRPGQLVVLESSTYPGTTRDVVLPILQSSGLKLGDDFFLAYSPEREDPGNPDFSARRIPRVVGGMDAASLELALALYRPVVAEVVPVSSCEVAEACKILENTYRSVNIAMVNELKILFDRMDLDIWEIIAAAKTKPFGFQAFYPGPGLGGHCIPIDPFYLSWIAKKHGMPTRFIELAGEINTTMPRYVIERLMSALNEHGKPLRGSRICLLGVAYKRDVDDPRESPAFELIERLEAAGAVLCYSDPHIPQLPRMRRFRVPELTSLPLTAEHIAAQDCLLIVTDHAAFDYAFIVEHAQLVLDSRNATRNVQEGREKIRKA